MFRNSRCNTLRGAFDGTLFPKHITNTSTFKIYRKAFCRTLTIHYSHSGKQYGIDAYWFKLAENAFDDSVDDPETSCYCKGEKTCMKRGLGNITPCYYSEIIEDYQLCLRLMVDFIQTFPLLFHFPIFTTPIQHCSMKLKDLSPLRRSMKI